MKSKISLTLLLLGIILISGCSLDGTYDPRVGDPSIANDPVPENNAIDQELFVRLEWNAEGAVSYSILLDTKNPPEKIFIEDTATTNANIFSLDYSTTYYWKVISKLTDGTERIGDIWSFTTKQRFSVADGAILEPLYFNKELPSNINVMFNAFDRGKRGISDYSKSDFEFFENDNLVLNQNISIKLKKKQNLSYLLKTILLINNTSSPEFEYDELKTAARSFVNNLSDNQEIEVYSFSDDVVLLQEFTSNTGLLSSAINGIQPVGNQTDLYGSIIFAAEKLEEIISLEEIVQTSIVFLTYNNDTREEYFIEDVLNEIIAESVYGIGIGNKLNLGVFILLSNKESFVVEQISDLENKLSSVQSLLSDYSNSLYLINYTSPEREDKFNKFKIFVKDNQYAGEGSTIEVTYNSADFFTAGAGLFINSNPNDPDGIDTLTLLTGVQRTLTASTFHADEPPFYSWVIGDPAIVDIELLNENNRARFTPLGEAGENTNLIVTDLNNGLQKILTIIIE